MGIFLIKTFLDKGFIGVRINNVNNFSETSRGAG
jgi:hypothetical protein